MTIVETASRLRTTMIEYSRLALIGLATVAAASSVTLVLRGALRLHRDGDLREAKPPANHRRVALHERVARPVEAAEGVARGLELPRGIASEREALEGRTVRVHAKGGCDGLEPIHGARSRLRGVVRGLLPLVAERQVGDPDRLGVGSRARCPGQ